IRTIAQICEADHFHLGFEFPVFATQQRGQRSEKGERNMFAATVPGAGGTTVTLSFTQQNIGLAQSVATSISNQVQAGTLFPVDYVGAPLPSPGPGQNLEVV